MKMYYPSFQELEEHFQENPIRIILLIHTKEDILERLTEGTMPCDGEWPEEQVAQFRRWVAQLLEMVDNLNNLCKSPLDWFFRH